jgi:hypothetical protein
MTLKNVSPAPPREVGPENAVPDTRPDLTLRERVGRRWNIGPNPVREAQPQSRNSGWIERQPPPTFGGVPQPRAGDYGASVVRRTPGNGAGAIVRLNRG